MPANMSQTKTIENSLAFTCIVLVLTVVIANAAFAVERPNVLFIAVDDLRPELTSFGADNMVTPNFDRLAKRGVRFDRAYCMVPTCGASRASLMTGIRPAKDRFITFTARADQEAPGVTTLNTHFQNHGYRTISLGKVFHNPADSKDGWSEPPTRPNAKRYITRSSIAATVKDKKGRSRGPSWENGGDVPDETYTDGITANQAISRLRELASRPDQPFFFAVGFTKPHLPFVAPGQYFEKYPVSEVQLPNNYFPPKAAPAGAVHDSGELRSYSDIPKTGVLSEAKARELIRGYHAATSYTDAHIGRLLDAFDELGLSENTVVVLWGDHGWNLGEHTMWCKHSCFETSLHAPLVLVTPDSMKLESGVATSSLVEFIDIYPTLCELTGLPLPNHLDGDSLVPILKAPTTSIKEQAISRFKDGDTIRTNQYRYTIYRDKGGQVTGHMLYDHKKDPGENVNVADDTAYAEVVETLAGLLQTNMGKPGDFRSSNSNAKITLGEAKLLNELELTEGQKPKFLSIQRSMSAKWAEFQKMDPQQRKRSQQAFFRARNEELKKLLTPEQMAKFREIRGRRNRQPQQSGPPAPNATRGPDHSQPPSPADQNRKDPVGSGAVELKRDKDRPTEGTSSASAERSTIGLAEIAGRTWLITPEGKPFFAHGITHTANRSLRADYTAVSKACKDLGFNAYGYGCPPELKQDMPYAEGRNYVPISTYRGKGESFRYIDIFDPREQQKLTAQVKQSCLQNRDNPNLIGYYWTDLGAWPLKNSVGKNWVDFIRGLPAEAPGHEAYAEFLKTWKGDDAKTRDLAFLRVIAREYFRVMGEANRKHDPDHLIFGDRFAFNTIVPEVLEEMLPWVDAIAIQPPFQPGFPKAKYREIHELTKKPILICDFAIRFKDGNKSIRGWQLQEDAQAAGVHYAKYIHAALETRYIIGAFWCNPVDSTPAFNGGGGLKQGLFADGLTRRPGLSEAVIELNRHISEVTPDHADAPEVK